MRLLIFLLLSAAAKLSFAADYSWTVTNWGATQFSSPQAACEAYKQRAVSYGGNWIAGISLSVSKVNETQFKCSVGTANTSPTWGAASTGYANRSGDSCPSGKNYDSATGVCSCPSGMIEDGLGQCVADNPCADLSGQIATTVENMGIAPPLSVGVNTVSACVNGCSVPMATQVACATSAKTWETSCLFKGFYDGLQCQASPGADPEPCVGDACLAPDPVTETEETPCVYVEDAEGRKVCSSTSSTFNDGSQNCSEVNGATQCFPEIPPKSDTTEIDTTVKTETNPDGSTTTTKTDTATSTQCSGANSCTSSTTTTTTVISKSPSGETTGTTTSCSGDNCQGKGDGEGDSGNCLPGQVCEEEEAVFESDELAEVPGFGESVGTFMSAIESAPLVASITTLDVPSGGSCNFPEGSTAIGTISMDSFCDLASVLDNLSAVFLAMWALAAIRILMSA
ncbi:hypothetical protein D3C78_449870 [compost metagenome]